MDKSRFRHPSSEPVIVIFGDKYVVCIVNFVYITIDRKGTGQFLVAFKFDREDKLLDKVQLIYTTSDVLERYLGIGEDMESIFKIFKK